MFPAPFVIADDNTVIALRYVESINMAKDHESTVMDNLKGDATLEIRTAGGVVYTISALRQKDVLSSRFKLRDTPQEIKSDIFERWVGFVN
jgi:hypothetical protein